MQVGPAVTEASVTSNLSLNYLMWQLKSETCGKQHPEKQEGINASLHESRISPNVTENNQPLN